MQPQRPCAASDLGQMGPKMMRRVYSMMPFSAVFHSVNLTPVCQTIILFCILLVGCDRAQPDRAGGVSDVVLDASSERIKAVTLDAREAPSESVLRAIRDLGATHLTLVSFGFQEATNVPEIRFSPDVRWYSESERGVRNLASKAAEMGMGIILKPQLWIRGGSWTAEIAFTSEEAWRRWESDYRAYLIYSARLAETIDADLLVIGTELAGPVQERPEFWRALIASIREVYDGKLTYGSNWHDDYDRVPFWDALDYVGVHAYFPISDVRDPSLADLREGWADHIRTLEAVSTEAGLPVLFTEIGYRSVSDAAREPWRWPSRGGDAAAVDFAIQADLYRAFFDEVWPQPWFAGAVIWKYYPSAAHPRMALDFTPQGKPAEEVIREGFR